MDQESIHTFSTMLKQLLWDNRAYVDDLGGGMFLLVTKKRKTDPRTGFEIIAGRQIERFHANDMFDALKYAAHYLGLTA